MLQLPLSSLEEALPGQTIERIDRRGKLLIVRFDRDALILHLGMTGQVTVFDRHVPNSPKIMRDPITGLPRVRQHPPDKHTHLQVWFADESALFFRDQRKFGKIYLFPIGHLDRAKPLAKLGMEPFTEQYQLSPFAEFLSKTRRTIKAVLLDQRFVAGIGNIYADESLFEARLRPSRLGSGLSKKEVGRLFDVIPDVLEKAIHHRGTTLRDYIDSDGNTGGYREQLRVYGRTGMPCVVCRTSIQRIILSQRSTHYCPKCQNRIRFVHQTRTDNEPDMG